MKKHLLLVAAVSTASLIGLYGATAHADSTPTQPPLVNGASANLGASQAIPAEKPDAKGAADPETKGTADADGPNGHQDAPGSNSNETETQD